MENGKEPINPIDYDRSYSYNGLTKREYFAGLAMQGLLANEAFQRLDSKQIAEHSIRRADELLKQLES